MQKFMLENLEICRKERHLTQAELAKKMNIQRYRIADWEQGRTEPSLENLVALAKTLKVSVEVLLGIDNFEAEEVRKQYENFLNSIRKKEDDSDDIRRNDLVIIRFDKYFYRPKKFYFKKGTICVVEEILRINDQIVYLIGGGKDYYVFKRRELEIYEPTKKSKYVN